MSPSVANFEATRSCSIAIAGGGLGGLCLAVGLSRIGIDVHVFEGAPELRTATSTIIGLGQNAFAALRAVHPDLEVAIKEAGCLVKESVFATHKAGETREIKRTYNYKAMKNDIYTVRWSKVQNALASLVPEHLVHCSHKVRAYTEEGEDGYVVVHFEGQPDVRCRLLVGADGVRSAVRQTMFPGRSPRYVGHMNWNTIIHNPGNSLFHAHEPSGILTVRDDDDDTWHVQGMFVDGGNGYTFWQIRVQSDTPAFTNGTGPGLGVPGSKARVLSLLQELGWQDAITAIEATPESIIYERALMDMPPLPRWQRCPGSPVVLLGDAVHAMHPGPGFGARSAFEDAHQLLEALQRHWPQDLEAALREYQEARIPRATRVQNFSAEGCGVAEIRQAVKPKIALTEEQRMQRYREFTVWVNQYPENMAGDPNSTYWKPEETDAAGEDVVLNGGHM